MNARKFSQLIKEVSFNLGIGPQIRSLIYTFDDLISRNILCKNRSLENIHKGERCFVIATGSSVNDIELSKLSEEVTFGCNFINYHPDIDKLKLNNFVSTPSPSSLKYSQSKSIHSESKIFSEEDILVWLEDGLELGTYSSEPYKYFSQIDSDLDNGTLIFLGAGSKKFIENNHIFKDKDVFYLKPYGSLLAAKEQIIDISKRITFFENTLFGMLAIAMYMGFKQIYLIGSDYTYEPVREFHFYDSLAFSKTIEKNIALKWIDDIAEARKMEVYKIVEDEDFYLPTFVAHNKKSRDAHVLVNKFAKSKGVRIVNIVPDGFASPIYEKVSWEYVVRDVLPS